MKKNFSILFLLSFLFSSCVTQQNVLTMLTPDGPQYFVRPVQLVSGNFKIILDCTLQVKDAEIQDDVIINYSVSPHKKLRFDSDLPIVVFSSSEGVFENSSISCMYTDIQSGAMRYSSTMSAQQFTLIVKNVDELSVLVKNKEYQGPLVVSRKLNKSLNMLTRVIN